jgi:cholesterol transport system auxiliary component
MTRLPPRYRLATLLLAAALSGCSLPLPDKPARAEPYDLGLPLPGSTQAATGVPVALAEIQAPAALDTRHLIYRLLYAGDAQQPRPYALARWTMPAPQLVAQRLREALAAQHPVLSAGSGLAVLEVQTRLEDFSQIFSSPTESAGSVRLSVTVTTGPGASGQRFLGQRLFTARHAAPTPDANGGAQALRLATDDVVRQAVAWIATLRPAQ